eukprot:Awhi_evm1s2985
MEVYQQDLAKYPGNVWSLQGLKTCYTITGRIPTTNFETELSNALLGCDNPTSLKYSCLCAGMN